jgi:hypothetical protein
MNLPMTNTLSSEDDRLLDLLVDGELRDVDRRDLLLRFEREPDGWRRCALAFLEVQTWREALSPLAAPAQKKQEPISPPGRVGRNRVRLPSLRLTGLAAAFLLVFALGWAFRAQMARMEPGTPNLPRPQESAVLPPTSPAPSASAPADLARQEQPGPRSRKPASVVDPLIKRWEQQGFSAETQERLVSMALKDGRKLNLPIREVRVRYVGDHTY